MPHIFIFLKSQEKNNSLLSNWLQTKSDFIPFFTKDFQSNNFYNKWNSIISLSCPILIVSQSICDEQDIEVLELFVQFCLTQKENFFYIPRPNQYLPVTKFALAWINTPSSIPQHIIYKKFIKLNLSNIIDLLPNDVSRIIKKNLFIVWSKFKKNLELLSKVERQGQTISSLSKIEKQPEMQVPNGLSLWHNQLWNEWNPPSALLHQLILEKTPEYFPHPLGIHVILLNQCNLKCVMCPYHSPAYRPYQTSSYFDELKSLNDELFTKIATYAGKNKISLQFGQIEEPLLHKNIFSYFEQAKCLGVPYIHVTTNGTLLNQQKAIELSNSGVDSVMFSIDAANPDTYKNIRGKDLLVLEENIKFFMSLAKNQKINVMVSFILQSQAKDEKEEFLKKWKRIGVNSVVFYVLTEHNPQTGESLRKEEMYHKGERYPCASPWIQSVVFPDGDISLCCKTMTDVGWRGVVSVGNLKAQSFEEIWLGEKYNQVRRELLENSFKTFDVCSDCHIWSASSYVLESTNEYTRSYNETMETINFI